MCSVCSTFLSTLLMKCTSCVSGLYIRINWSRLFHNALLLAVLKTSCILQLLCCINSAELHVLNAHTLLHMYHSSKYIKNSTLQMFSQWLSFLEARRQRLFWIAGPACCGCLSVRNLDCMSVCGNKGRYYSRVRPNGKQTKIALIET